MEVVAGTSNAIAGWHFGISFGLASKPVEDAGILWGRRRDSKLMIEVNSWYGVFEEKNLPRTEIENKKHD